MTRLLAAHKNIDILVGRVFHLNEKYGTSLLTTSTTDHKAILEVDTIESVRLAKAVVRSILAKHRGGVIINISSTPAMSGNFEGAPYTKAKAAGYGRRNIRAYTLMLYRNRSFL